MFSFCNNSSDNRKAEMRLEGRISVHKQTSSDPVSIYALLLSLINATESGMITRVAVLFLRLAHDSGKGQAPCILCVIV